MKYTVIIIILFNGLFCSSLIKGRILDIDSKAPISGANVYIEESGIGSSTDEFGTFLIQADAKKLRISHIAYLDIDYFIGDSEYVTIFLEPSVINSEELIVTGTRTAKTFKDSAALLAPGGHLLIIDLSRHDQDWARNSCGDLWLGFDENDLDRWAEDAGLVSGQSSYLSLRNGFQIQICIFKKNIHGA